MRSYKIIFTFVSILILVIGVQVNSAFAITGQSEGYVQYSVSIKGDSIFSIPTNFLINETVISTSQTDFVSVTLALSSDTTNFTYSKDLNSSSLPMLFPYLSGLTNQSLTYEVEGISISANLVNSGQVPVSFDDTIYQATKYLVNLSAMNTSNMKSISAEGNITSMPSGLIYNIHFSLNQTLNVDVTLISTNLDLNEPSSNVDPLGASILGIGAIVAVGLAAPTIFKKLKPHKPNNQGQNNKSKTNQDSSVEQESEKEKKPAYWVD